MRQERSDRIRRIGLLMNVTADHPDATPRLAAFRDTLRELGWVEGRNVSIEVRWGGADFRTLSAIRSGIGCARA